MRILVTGGAGFIGSNFIRCLLDEYPGDVEVVNLDKLTYAGWEHTIADLESRPGYRFVAADITDVQALQRIFAGGIDTVIHFAAESHVDRSIVGPDLFVTTNVGGTHCVVEAARRAGVKRYIQISSDEVYGSLPEGSRAGPEGSLQPGNPYAASKAGADLLVLAAHRTYGFPAIITRCTNNYGPWQHPEKFVPRMTLQALQGEALPVYGDGQQIRNWIHVDDHCRALLAVVQGGVDGRVYTIAGDDSLPNLDVARRIVHLVDVPGAATQHVEDRPGHDRRYALDDSATRSELGWQPRRSFNEGLEATVAWYRNNQSWWQRITETQSPVVRVG